MSGTVQVARLHMPKSHPRDFDWHAEPLPIKSKADRTWPCTSPFDQNRTHWAHVQSRLEEKYAPVLQRNYLHHLHLHHLISVHCPPSSASASAPASAAAQTNSTVLSNFGYPAVRNGISISLGSLNMAWRNLFGC